MQSLWFEHQLNFDAYYMNFNNAFGSKKNLRSSPWTALISCANFSQETGL